MSAIRLGTAGCVRSFQSLSTALLAHDAVFRSMINTEALEDEQGRFRVWSGNLGALQKGHSSLDYRLRDSPLLQTNVLKLLNELGANLSEAVAVVSGGRLPFEQQAKPDGSENGDDVWSQDEEDSDEDEAPKTELEQRFLDIVDIIDNLYKLSVRIRSPTLRSRSLKAASYRPVDPDTGIDIFEQYASFDLQHTQELLSHIRFDSSAQRAEEDDYLVERLSKAITLRRRQFKYWRRHRDKLGASSSIEDIKPQLPLGQQEIVKVESPPDKTSETGALNVTKEPTSEWTPKSLLSGTEVTQHHHSLDEVVDIQSITSYATTTRDLAGRGIELPSPPKTATRERDFECPYCFIICPARYGKGRAWRTHILQDLQPYVCTYKDCKDSDQLFRSRREWSEHEAGHRKLWRCPEHSNAVFRSSAGLEDHLHQKHPGSFADEQLPSIVKVGETSSIDLRQTCPICFADATMEAGLQNHIANHLERLAAFALPKDVNSAEDESDGASSAASRGKSIESSTSQHLTPVSSYSGSISRQSDDATDLDGNLVSKTSQLAGETQSFGSQSVSLKQGEAINALSADLLGLLPDASNQKMDLFFLSSQQNSEESASSKSIGYEPEGSLRDDRPEPGMQSTEGFEGANQPSVPIQQRAMSKVLALSDIPTLDQEYKTSDQSHYHTSMPRLYFNQKISLIFHDITQLNVDAIVNSANSSLSPSGAGRLNDAIHSAAGPELAEECKRLNSCAIGDAKITGAYNLPCAAVIHAVKHRSDSDEPVDIVDIENCYRQSLRVAIEHKLKSIAFPTLSLILGSHAKTAAQIAIQVVRGFLVSGEGDGLDRIIFCVHSRPHMVAYMETLPLYFPPTISTIREDVQESDLGNPLHEQPTRSQRTLTTTSDSLVNDQPTGEVGHSSVNQENYYYAYELNDLSSKIEDAVQQLMNFAHGTPNFEQVTIELSRITSILRALEKLFTKSESPISKFTGRTLSDFDLLYTVLQSVSEGLEEMMMRTRYTKEFSVPAFTDLWNDFTFHLKNSGGFSFPFLLQLCGDFVQSLLDILQNGTGHSQMDVMRDNLARYRLKQPIEDAGRTRIKKFEEFLLSREFTSHSNAEPQTLDIIEASQIPNLNDLYRLGRLRTMPTSSKVDPVANDIICLIRHDITRLKVDAIVNSTDREFSSFGTLDKAVFEAAGPGMRKETSKYGICEDGSVKLTEGYQLPCSYVCHVVPPEHYQTRGPSAEAFRKCYSGSLNMALGISARTIAFPAIGAGLLGYPRFAAVSIAIEEVQKFLAQHKTRVLDKIIFCVFEETDESVYRTLLPKYFPPADNLLKTVASPSLEGDDDSKGDGTAPIPIPGAQPRQRTEFSGSIEESSNNRMTEELYTLSKEKPTTVASPNDVIDETMVEYIINARDLWAIKEHQSELQLTDCPWACCRCFARPMITKNCLICFHGACQGCDSYSRTKEKEMFTISLVPLFLPEVHADLPKILHLRNENNLQGHEEKTAASGGDAPASTNQGLNQTSVTVSQRVHRRHLSLDTLIYYGLKWKIDKRDQGYIIILHELTEAQLVYLFEHTRILRKALQSAVSTLRLHLGDVICLGDQPGWWRGYSTHFGLPVLSGSISHYTEQSRISVARPEAGALQWTVASHVSNHSQSNTRLNWSPRDSSYLYVQNKASLHPGIILGFGHQDDDVTLPFLPVRVECDMVEALPETQADIWQAARARAHDYGFYLPHEGEQQRVHFSDEPPPLPLEPADQDTLPSAKGILRPPTEKFPEDPDPIREGVAPLKDSKLGNDIPSGARWTKIDRRLVNPEALEEAKERFEERQDCVIVLRVLSKEEIQMLAQRTHEIRDARESAKPEASSALKPTRTVEDTRNDFGKARRSSVAF
ncbi:hypothetical protein AOQ84DRAFT_375290 [Glonium stellatum]|uniref:Macro domain-containing protein n=1 Tax=Glonium stellatum TaxID=574774 RepID=A0A8E2F402_9PEZI|nr:hypothetical protein AOQ84DRAFT_375290 [Glonium stellatum]